MKKSNQKENRRNFIKDTLWKGLLLSLAGSLPRLSLASEDEESLRTDLYYADGKTIDWDKVKGMFTLAPHRRHFNTASIGPSPKKVQDKTIEAIRYINKYGLENHKQVDRVRIQLGQLLNTEPTQLAITRNTTEGMNIIARSIGLQKGDEVIITNQEHIGGSAAWLTLKNELGIKVTVLDIGQQEEHTCTLLQRAITSHTKVISVSHITCTTGAILPVKDIITLCKKHTIISVIDGAQAVGQIPVNLKDLEPDFYVSSGHKWLYGPKGTGILYLNKDFLINTGPLFSGAYTDRTFDLKTGLIEYVQSASRYEYGTINAPIVAGLGAALDFVQIIGKEQIAERCKQLSSQFYRGIKNHAKIVVLTPEDQERRAAMVTFRITGTPSSEVCRKLIQEESTVLRNVHENNLNAIRASFAIFTSEEEVDELVVKIRTLADAND